MLNEEQLATLDDIFINEIVPVFEEESKRVDDFMKKIDEYECKKYIQESRRRP